MSKNTVIGLTGGIATGKSTAAKIFKKLGCKIVDADAIAHKIIKHNTSAYRKITAYFGKDILEKNREINRSKLASIIFSNKNKRLKLNAITHPYIIKEIKKQIKNLKCKLNVAAKRSFAKIIILDAPLLFEAKITLLVDKILVIASNEEAQIKRLIKKYNLSPDKAKLRVKSQMPLAKKIKYADYVINNNAKLTDLRKKVKNLYLHTLSPLIKGVGHPFK
ncbi:MAG: dephospho-CoA kinase [Candidatus Firestonebacteria bacterium]